MVAQPGPRTGKIGSPISRQHLHVDCEHVQYRLIGFGSFSLTADELVVGADGANGGTVISSAMSLLTYTKIKYFPNLT